MAIERKITERLELHKIYVRFKRLEAGGKVAGYERVVERDQALELGVLESVNEEGDISPQHILNGNDLSTIQECRIERVQYAAFREYPYVVSLTFKEFLELGKKSSIEEVVNASYS